LKSLDVPAITEEFNLLKPKFEKLEGEASFILTQSIQQAGLKVHSISSRVKSLDSFIDKAIRKEYEKPLEEINDLVGLRVVLLFLSDIPRVARIIDQNFNILAEDNKIEPSEPTSFEYMSHHFIGQLKDSHTGLRYDDIKGVSFEIQVRTILMDAWANVSHYLDYKAEASIPSDLRRDFYALSGLFYVADRHFQLFYGESRDSQRHAIESIVKPRKPNLNQEINLDTLAAYLRQKFPGRNPSEPRPISQLVEELVRNGYSTLAEIDRQLDRAQEALAQFERQQYAPGAPGAPGFNDVGAVRISMAIADEKYLKMADLEAGQNSQPYYPEKAFRHLLRPEQLPE
jgi:putative GTP pyrophosphokinase